MRINKFLSTLGIASRRAIDKYIEEGRITVNGDIATTGMDINENDDIFIDGKKIKTNINEEKVYFMLNKPLEVLSSSSDDRGRKTVVDLIKTDKRIFPIGRLDYMTSGLILLTNDGELFNRIVHPKSEIYKKYYVKIANSLSDDDIKMLENGIKLEENFVTKKAKVEIICNNSEKNENLAYITISEGKFHQVKRMFKAVNNEVLYLKRMKMGNLLLDENLKLGKYRELTTEELDSLKV